MVVELPFKACPGCLSLSEVWRDTKAGILATVSPAPSVASPKQDWSHLQDGWEEESTGGSGAKF